MSDDSEYTKARLLKLLDDKKIDRKEFGRWLLRGFGTSVYASTAIGAVDEFSKARAQSTPFDFEAVIVGSGIGGSVAAARLSRKWPEQVLMVERGKRYPKGSFPRSTQGIVDALRRDPSDHTPRPLPLPGKSNGVLDVRSYDGIDVMTANGYGGGSLLYAAAIVEPGHPDFDREWPASMKRAELAPYWDIFKSVMGAAPAPITGEPERDLPQVGYWDLVASKTGGRNDLIDVGVFFGNDPNQPAPLGQVQINAHGAEQESCRYCAECLLGCNYHAKSSTDLNYLHVAEHRYGMQVRTETQVSRIVPLNSRGRPSVWADGEHGYEVTLEHVETGERTRLRTRRVVLAAGALGSTEILLKNKRWGTLWRVSRKLGERFSSNGDFLGLTLNGQGENGGSYGPCVTQTVDYNKPGNPDESFVLEGMSLPRLSTVIEWLVGVCQQAGSPWESFWQNIKNAVDSDPEGKNTSYSAFVFVGLDASDGEMELGWYDELRLKWSYWDSRKLFGAMTDTIRDVQHVVDADASLYLPTYIWPLRRNFTVHPLGGCGLSTSSWSGVTDSSRDEFGRVYGYDNLHVADGSLIPSAVGANPSLTIGALSEMVCEAITGEPATYEL